MNKPMQDMVCAREVQLISYKGKAYLWVDVYGNSKLSKMAFDVTGVAHTHWFYQDAFHLLTGGVELNKIPGIPVIGVRAAGILTSTIATARATYDHLNGDLMVVVYDAPKGLPAPCHDVMAYLVNPCDSEAVPVLMSLGRDGEKVYTMQMERM